MLFKISKIKNSSVLIVCLFFAIAHVFGQNKNASNILLEGEITFVSKLPNPNEINYPNCNYTAVIQANTSSKNTKLSVVIKGIVNKKYTNTANFKIGDKLKLTLIPFDNASEEIRQTQLVDEVDDFDMEVYYAEKVSKIKKYSKSLNSKNVVTQKKRVTSIPIVSINKKASRKREKAIKSELKRIQKLLKSHGGTWKQWEEDIAEFKIDYTKAYETKASKWINNSYFSAGKAYSEINEGNFVEAMVNFNNYLKQFNIDLIVIRIPFKGEVVGDLFSDKLSDHVVNPYAMKVTSNLLENDVEVIDILPKLIKEREQYPLLFWYNDFDEKHPGEPVAWIVANEVNELLKRYPEYAQMPKVQTFIKDTIGVRSGKPYKWPEGNTSFSPKKSISYKSVIDSLGNIIKLDYDKNTSPFLFIGNSFLAYPSIARGGSIPHYFTHKSGLKPDIYYRSGGIGLGRLIYKKGLSFLENRRAIIYVALPSSFQGNVPVIPLSASIDKDKFQENNIITLDKNNWKQHVEFSEVLSEKNIFNITKEGYISALWKNGIASDGGHIKITLPNTTKPRKNDILKVAFEFKSVGYSEVIVKYAGQEKSFLRSQNVKDNYFENVYFKIPENTAEKEITVSFHTVKRKQKIKKIKVTLLTSK